MNKIKKINLKVLGIFIFLVFIILSLLMIKKPSYAYTNERIADTIYSDYSDISTVDNKYSNSVLFLSENSEIIKIKGPAGTQPATIGDISFKSFYEITPSTNADQRQLVLLITKSAVDSNGNLLDTVITLSNINFWPSNIKHGSGRTITFEIKSAVSFMKNQNPDKSKYVIEGSLENYRGLPTNGTNYDKYFISHPLVIGDPLILGLDTVCTDVDFTLTYYKADTVNRSDGTGGEIATDINSINSFYTDLDVPRTRYIKDTSNYTTSNFPVSTLNQLFLQGNEGIAPMNGKSQIFYDTQNRTGTYFINLAEMENGIVSQESKASKNYEYLNSKSIWYQSSAFMLTDGVEGSFKFKYGGINCGINFSFFSPFLYSIPNPTKDIINKQNEYNISDTFVYKVSQYVPNTYFSQSIGFSSVYSNIKPSSIFEQFVIEDELESHLSFDETKSIVVKRDNNTDVTSLFDINIDNKKVTATALDTSLNNSAFYAHSYILEIPVKFNSSGVNVKTIKNTATVTSKLPDTEPIINDTNEVDVNVYYNVVSRYLLEGTNEVLAPSKTIKKYSGDAYNTESSSDVPSKYELVSVPSNASGTINDQNILVTYYYKLIDRMAKLYKVDSETNEHVLGAILEVYDKNDDLVAKWTTNNNINNCNLAVVGNTNGCEVYNALLPNETYKVVEKTTPSGYATSEVITFTTDEIGNYSEKIIISNTPIKVCISTVDKNNNTLAGIKVEMRESNNNLYKSFTSTNGETCYSRVPINNYKLEETKLIDNYIKPDIKNIEVIDTKEVQHFKIINNKLPKIEVCMKVNNVTTLNSNKKFPVLINNLNYETWMSLKHNECESIFVNPGNYNIKEIIPQEYNLVSVTGAITSNGSSITTELDKEYKVTFTNEFTKKGFYHSDGRAENKVVIGG